MDILSACLIILICIIMGAFFSGSEFAVVSADQMKLRNEASQGSKSARLALDMLKKPRWLLSTTLVGTNISVVATATMATALSIQLFGEKYSWIAILISAPLIWIFGEIVSKSIFQQHADFLTPKIIFPLRGASFLFYPILVLFSGLTWLATRFFGNERDNPFTRKEQIAMMMVMPTTQDDIQPVERAMIHRVIKFTETTAGDIMIPLIDVIGIKTNATCGDAVRLAAEKEHSLLPVYDMRIDKIIGAVNAFDFLLINEEDPIGPFIQHLRYIPRLKSIEDLLGDFRKEGDKMAVVVDEFGGAEGIVTLEDIFEEIVGEMEDEHDEKETNHQWIRELGAKDYMVSARIECQTLHDRLNIRLPRGDYKTLGGFLLEIFKEIPAEGMTLQHRKISFTIKRVSEKAIEEVRIRW